jgi:hypothetical protein
MSLRNRVDPFGTILAVPHRGTFMGNRGGRIHKPATKTIMNRHFASKRWIICLTAYKDRQRDVMSDGYTELFFLDEVTALAAGHRPCAECRRAAYKSYKTSCEWSGNIETLDSVLHRQRLAERSHFVHPPQYDIPDGVMVAIGQAAFAKRGDYALRWNFDGYTFAGAWLDIAEHNPNVLTPALTITALQNGFKPVWHPSATL